MLHLSNCFLQIFFSNLTILHITLQYFRRKNSQHYKITHYFRLFVFDLNILFKPYNVTPYKLFHFRFFFFNLTILHLTNNYNITTLQCYTQFQPKLTLQQLVREAFIRKTGNILIFYQYWGGSTPRPIYFRFFPEENFYCLKMIYILRNM